MKHKNPQKQNKQTKKPPEQTTKSGGNSYHKIRISKINTYQPATTPTNQC